MVVIAGQFTLELWHCVKLLTCIENVYMYIPGTDCHPANTSAEWSLLSNDLPIYFELGPKGHQNDFTNQFCKACKINLDVFYRIYIIIREVHSILNSIINQFINLL